MGYALADAYERAAREAGHEVHRVDVADLDLGFLRTKRAWDTEMPAPEILSLRERVEQSDHLAIFFPLWLGTMPAYFKAFWEQLLRTGAPQNGKATAPSILRGKSARIVVTMGMPAPFFRWYFGGYGVKSLERGILKIMGVAPIHTTLLGSVDGRGEAGYQRWMKEMSELGRRCN
uniref:NAD(P)H dehydrogenase (Quinone) n=1 Tax=mine drainage metagenome TaxID=410659 RepID=E6Q4Q5_9ZZZZ